MINKFSIIISNTLRSYCYLKTLRENNLTPCTIIYLDDNLNNKIAFKLKKKKFFFPSVKLKLFKSKDINGKVSKFILSLTEKNIVYSGYSGIIIKETLILNKKNLIHSHSGKLPKYKGSTTIYYSILNEKKIFCSTIILNKNLDNGKILLIKKYSIPRKIKFIDENYDNKIRSKNLIQVLKNYKILKKNIKIQKILSHTS